MKDRCFKSCFVILISTLLVSVSQMIMKDSIQHIDLSSNEFSSNLSKMYSQNFVKQSRKYKFSSRDTGEEAHSTQKQDFRRNSENLGCSSDDVMSNGGFCLSAANMFVGFNHYFNPNMCYFVEDLVGNSSVADFGAGLGFYGMYHLRATESPFTFNKTQQTKHWRHYIDPLNGAVPKKPQIVYSWDGFDGAYNIETLSGGFIKYADLRQKNLWLGRRWDWVVSVEVGEHIEKEFEDNFLDNLVKHACKGIVLTWALPIQDGHHHVNSQENAYIKQKMKERKFVSFDDAEYILKRNVLDHMAASGMVFQAMDATSCLLG